METLTANKSVIFIPIEEVVTTITSTEGFKKALVLVEPIVLSGGYEDDKDLGDEIIYTGEGGRDPNTGAQVADQTVTRGNKQLIENCNIGHPIRVIRAIN